MNSEEVSRQLRQYKIGLAIFFAAALVLAGFSLKHENDQRYDENLVSRMSSISSDLSGLQYKEEHTELPENIDSYVNGSQEGVEYRRLSSSQYELCAEFRTNTGNPDRKTYDNNDGYIDADSHSKGRNCYKATLRFDTSRSYRNNKAAPDNEAMDLPASAVCGITGIYYSGAVGTIDTAQRRIYQNGATATSTNFVRYDENTKFYDNKCSSSTINSFKTGDTITFVTSFRNGQYYADAIKR